MKTIIYALPMLLMAGYAQSQDDKPDVTIGSWLGYTYPDKTVLATTNDDNVSLSYGCKESGCGWALVIGPKACREGDSLPIIVAGSAGSVAAQGGCIVSDDVASVIQIEPADGVTTIVTGSSEIDIAIPGRGVIVTTKLTTRGFGGAQSAIARAKK